MKSCRLSAGIILVLGMVFPGIAASGEAPLEETAKRIAGAFCEDPRLPEELFHKSFLQEVPVGRVVDICRSLYRTHGDVSSVTPEKNNRFASGRFTFLFRNGDEMTVTLSIESGEPHRIVGLFFASPRAGCRSMEEVLEGLRRLPGTVGFAVARLDEGGPRVTFSLNPDKPLAIGSAFKLYILGALLENRVSWDEVVTLKAERKSLPSGVLHTWPAGSPLTVHTLAAQMISISDNTATDHLLFHLGREKVEKMLEVMGNRNASMSRPFLSTLEMFKVKSVPGILERYLSADVKGRRSLLAGEVADLPRNNLSFPMKPTAVERVEWFASSADLCRAMHWFHRRNDGTALEILAINPGIGVPGERFPYAGFKGGSEPGVLNLTLLLRTKEGAAYALAGSWNDIVETLDHGRFLSLFQAAVSLLGLHPEEDR